MLIEKVMETETKEYKRERYTYSKDGKSYEVSCDEISNGYIVCIYETWYEGEGDKKEYKSKETKTYYEENPFGDSLLKEEKEDKIDPIKGLKAFMEKLNPVTKY